MSEFSRLPNDIIPKLYDLKLTVDLKTKVFLGKLSIEIDVVTQTKSIHLNSHNLLINNVLVNGSIKCDVVYLKDCEKIVLNFADDIPLGKSILDLDYSGTLNTSMKGFYYSSHKSADGSIEDMGVTQFEPTNARYAFPCWDEPALRAQFKISILCAKHLMAISNMSLKSVTDCGDMALHEFEITPLMSTYLVAFAIGNLERHVLADDRISVYCRREASHESAAFALDVAARSLAFYNEWFGIPYCLPKLDMLAAPDFAAGAMENWGLVISRECCLLVGDAKTSVSTKQRAALRVCHELAHMWFGNLVTLQWWTDLWLKEGFAKWMEYFCVDHIFPNYDIWNLFAANQYFRTLQLDSMISTHPIEVEVKSPSEISEIFDDISYDKGASVIRMLFNYLGEEEFQAGLKLYLNTYKFKATKTEDLWNSLQECTDKPVKDVMNSWTRQPGYPVVNVEIKFSETEHFIDSIKFSQKRFFQFGENVADTTQWNIPITIANSENPREEILSFVMTDNVQFVDMTSLGERCDCVFVNPSAIGIYRVFYQDKTILNRLKNCLTLSSWSASDKFSFLEDCFALANAGKMGYADVLEMLDFMKEEKSFTIWSMVSANLRDIYNLLDESIHGVANIGNFIKNLATHNYKRLGWAEHPNDTNDDVLLRPLIIHLLAKTNDEDVVWNAKDIFSDLIDNGKQIPTNIRVVVYSIIGMHASEQEFGLLINAFAKCDSLNEKDDILNGLGKVPLILQDKFVDWVMSPNVRDQDKYSGLSSSANRSSKHRELIWTLIKAEWNRFREMYSGQFLIGNLLKGCLNGFCNKDKMSDIKIFFEENDSKSPRNVNQVIENIENNIRRFYLHTDNVHEYLTRHST